MTAIRVVLSKELHKRIKMRALQKDMSLQQIVPIALEAYLAPVAKSAKVAKIAKRAK
jgi:predicted HicB family RNase H-like nuclease